MSLARITLGLVVSYLSANVDFPWSIVSFALVIDLVEYLEAYSPICAIMEKFLESTVSFHGSIRLLMSVRALLPHKGSHPSVYCHVFALWHCIEPHLCSATAAALAEA